MAGWFKVERDIQDHSIWKSKEPFDRRSAWIDMILLANYKDFKAIRNNKIVLRKRGEVNTSYRFLADRWHWSKNRVVNFLRLLESDGMVTVASTADGTTITIENYAKYQDVGDSYKDTNEDTEGTLTRTRKGHSRDTNEDNDKKTKEYYKEDYKEGKEGKGQIPGSIYKDQSGRIRFNTGR